MNKESLKEMKSRKTYLANVNGQTLKVYKTDNSRIINYNTQVEIDPKEVTLIKILE